MNIFNNFRIVTASLSLFSLLAIGLAMQTHGVERHLYQESDLPVVIHHQYQASDYWQTSQPTQQNKNNRQSSRRVVPRTYVDSVLLQDLRERQRANSRKKPPVFGSPYFGSIVPHGTPSTKTKPKPVAPIVPKKPKPTPATVKSPFANFSSLVPTSAAANMIQVQAEENFRQGNYSLAAYQVDQAMGIDDKNGHLKMFASLANMAIGKFEDSGRLFRSATKTLKPAEWHEVFANAELIYGKHDFEKHLKDLDAYCKENSFSIAARRLRGFHCLLNGRLEIAKSDFEFVLSNDPNDSVTNQLFGLLSPKRKAPVPKQRDNRFQNHQRIVNPMIDLTNKDRNN